MCLSKLTPDVKLTTNRGWKIFAVVTPRIHYKSLYFPKRLYSVDEWYEDDNEVVIHCDFQRADYHSGFHIYLDKYDALRDYKNNSRKGRPEIALKEVQFDKVITVGTQENKQVVVARRIKICV